MCFCFLFTSICVSTAWWTKFVVLLVTLWRYDLLRCPFSLIKCTSSIVCLYKTFNLRSWREHFYKWTFFFSKSFGKTTNPSEFCKTKNKPVTLCSSHKFSILVLNLAWRSIYFVRSLSLYYDNRESNLNYMSKQVTETFQ